MIAYDVARIVLIAAAIFAWKLVRVAPQHRPAAWALSALAVIDVALKVGELGTPPRIQAALFLASYAVQVALALKAFGRVPPALEVAHGAPARLVAVVLKVLVRFAPWAALVAWAVAVAAVELSFDQRDAVYKVAFKVAISVQLGSIALFVSRRPRELPSFAQGVSAIIGLSAIPDAVGPWLHGMPRIEWAEGGKAAFLTWMFVLLWEVNRWKACTRR